MYPNQAALDCWAQVIQQSRLDLDAFADVFRRFSQLVDSAHKLSVPRFLRELDLILPELYLASRRLPSTEDWFEYGDDDSEDDGVDDYVRPGGGSQSEPLARFRMLSQKLLWVDLNLEIYDPYRHLNQTKGHGNSENPIGGSLSDCLDHLCQEAEWLPALASNNTRDVFEAAFHLRMTMDGLQGHHVADAIRAVRSLLYEHEDLWVEDETYWEPLPEGQ